MPSESMLFVTREVLIWFSILLAVPVQYFLYNRWEKTDHLSPGHFWTGLSSTFLFALSLILCAAKPDLAYLFCWIGIVAVVVSLGYENWYFNRYPVKLQPIERYPPYVPSSKFIKAMGEPSTVIRHRWLQPLSKPVVQWGILVFVIGFGFSRMMNAVVFGNQLLVKQQNQTQQQLAKVPTAGEIKQAISTAVAPLAEDTKTVKTTVLGNTSRIKTIEKKALTDNNEEQNYRRTRAGKKTSAVSKVPVYVSPIKTSTTALDSINKPIYLAEFIEPGN